MTWIEALVYRWVGEREVLIYKWLTEKYESADLIRFHLRHKWYLCWFIKFAGIVDND